MKPNVVKRREYQETIKNLEKKRKKYGFFVSLLTTASFPTPMAAKLLIKSRPTATYDKLFFFIFFPPVLKNKN